MQIKSRKAVQKTKANVPFIINIYCTMYICGTIISGLKTFSNIETFAFMQCFTLFSALSSDKKFLYAVFPPKNVLHSLIHTLKALQI
jgi:hypothetical protein